MPFRCRLVKSCVIAQIWFGTVAQNSVGANNPAFDGIENVPMRGFRWVAKPAARK